MKKLTLLLLVASSTMLSAAQDEWNFGVGTGPVFLSAEGEEGFNMKLGGIGPVTLDLDLKPDDFSDAAETMLGLGGYATNGQWLFTGTVGFLALEGSASTTFGPQTVSAELDYDIFTAELTAGYLVHASDRFVVFVYGGVRYLSHDITLDLGATGPVTGRVKRGLKEDWADALIGVTADVILAEEWTWNNRLEAGYGGSDGSYLAKTGLTWRFAESWSASVYTTYYAIDYENGDKGDSDWYLYDVDESNWGLNLMYHW